MVHGDVENRSDKHQGRLADTITGIQCIITRFIQMTRIKKVELVSVVALSLLLLISVKLTLQIILAKENPALGVFTSR